MLVSPPSSLFGNSWNSNWPSVSCLIASAALRACRFSGCALGTLVPHLKTYSAALRCDSPKSLARAVPLSQLRAPVLAMRSSPAASRRLADTVHLVWRDTFGAEQAPTVAGQRGTALTQHYRSLTRSTKLDFRVKMRSHWVECYTAHLAVQPE